MSVYVCIYMYIYISKDIVAYGIKCIYSSHRHKSSNKSMYLSCPYRNTKKKQITSIYLSIYLSIYIYIYII